MIPVFCPATVLSTGASFEAETTTWVNAVVGNGGSVSNGRKTTVNTLIANLKGDGVWSKLDRLWLLAAENEVSALTDLVATGTATKVSTPTFTTDVGYTGEDSALPTKYLDSNFNPSTAGGHFVQDSAHISSWNSGNVTQSTGGCSMGYRDGTTKLATHIFAAFSDGNGYFRINDSTPSGSGGALANVSGHYIANRSGASASQAYRNGSLFASPNDTSGAVQNLKFFLTCMNGDGTPFVGNSNQLTMASIGGSLTGTDASNFYTRLRTYMTAVGVP